MESKFIWEPVPKEDFNGTLDFDPANITDGDDVEYIIGLGISDLREDPDYIRFYINWTRLITTGVLPFGALIYFNFGIFRGIQVQSYNWGLGTNNLLSNANIIKLKNAYLESST